MDTIRQYTGPISRKLVGRITESFSQRSFKAIDPTFLFIHKKEKEEEGKKEEGKKKEGWKVESKKNIYSHLLTIPDHTEIDLVRLEKLNTEFPDILYRLVNCAARLGPRIDSISLKELSSFFISVFLGEKSLSELELTIGIGGTDSAPSVRIPIVILPAVFLLEEILKIKKEFNLEGSPKVHVFKSQNIAQDVNGINPEKAQSVTTLTFIFLKKYIQEFHPALLSHFDFIVDDWYYDLKDEIVINLDRSKKAAEVSGHLENILKMGGKHGGKKGEAKALYYAGAHPIYNGFLDIGKTLNGHIRSEKKGLNINLGGFAERVFNGTMRQLTSNADLKFNPSAFIVFDRMKRASYYAGKGDVSVDDFNSFKNVAIDSFHPQTTNDITTILADSHLTLSNYLEFIRK